MKDKNFLVHFRLGKVKPMLIYDASLTGAIIRTIEKRLSEGKDAGIFLVCEMKDDLVTVVKSHFIENVEVKVTLEQDIAENSVCNYIYSVI